MKILNKMIQHAMVISLCVTPILPLFSLSSCNSNSDQDIQAIIIKPQEDVVFPGHSVKMIITWKPRKLKKPQIRWELLDLPEHLKSVTIDNDGIVNVPSSVSITSATTITVKATLVHKEEVNATASLTVAKEGSTGLIGFENGQIKYLDPNRNEAKMDINLIDGHKYETAGYIDMFMSETIPEELRETWKSFVDFKPLFSSGKQETMQFYRVNTFESQFPSITWETAYSDGSETTTIPSFYSCASDFPSTSIVVKFPCDPLAELTIHFRLWQSRTQTTDGHILYLPDSVDDNYEIKLQGEGEYICNIYCPIKKSEKDDTVYSGTVSTIYCFGGVKEFTDYEPVWDESILKEPAIKKAFQLEPKPFEKHISAFDGTPYWTTGFDYSFDTSEMPTTETYEYQSFQLFVLRLHDKWQIGEQPLYSAYCTFSIEWIDV